MTDKRYIVVNKEQELDVLGKLEEQGFKWADNTSPLEWLPSKEIFSEFTRFLPYTITANSEDNTIMGSSVKIDEDNVVFDGRKEEKMTKMYKVTQEFMNELVEWKKDRNLGIVLNVTTELLELPAIVRYWQRKPTDFTKCNNRLIAIIQWLNGEDVFEVEEPHKFVVRSENVDEGGHYGYVAAGQSGISYNRYYVNEATKFNTREEAQEWANSHQVVVEIDVEGNEVE